MSNRPPRATLLTPYHEYLRWCWTEGCHNAAQLLREISQRDYQVKRSMVNKTVTKWRKTGIQPVLFSARDLRLRTPSPRWAAFLLLQPAEKRTSEQQSFVDRLIGSDEVGPVTELARQFAPIIRERQSEEFDGGSERRTVQHRNCDGSRRN